MVDSVTFTVGIGSESGVTLEDAPISFRTRLDGAWERRATRPDGSEDSAGLVAGPQETRAGRQTAGVWSLPPPLAATGIYTPRPPTVGTYAA